MPETIPVTNNETARRFEAVEADRTAFLDYRRHGSSLVLIHTEVPSEMEGRGVAGSLAKTALEYARNERLRVVPRCSFVSSYLKRHPEYQDLENPE